MPSRMSLGAVSSTSGMIFCMMVLHCSIIMVRRMWATLTGKMSLHELMALLGRLEYLAV